MTMPMPSTNTVLITGATGNTGAVLLRLLEERGVAVRAMIRREHDIARLGRTSASIVIGDFDDANSIASALDGVDSVYLVTPSSINAEAQQIRFAELAAAANVKHLVKLSQFAADAEGEREHSDKSKAGMLHQQPDSITQVLKHFVLQSSANCQLFRRLEQPSFGVESIESRLPPR
jgi:nucleoside-diphosphate-sugar epimerase